MSTTFEQFALADDERSLDPDSAYNAQFRDGGLGFVPNLLSADPERKAAVIGCGAIEAILVIPFGWHALDDGQRTLIFDRDSQIQINFNLMNFQGASMEEVIRSLVAATLAEYKTAEHLELSFGTDQPGLAFRNMNDNGTLLQQCYLWRTVPHHAGVHLQVRVTAENDQMDRAMNLLELLMSHIRFPDMPTQ